MTDPTLSRLPARFADYPPERVLLDPPPGSATKQDVIELQRHERLCELIDGVLVEKAMGFREARVALRLGRRLDEYAEKHNLAMVVGADGTVELFPGQVRIPDVAFYSWGKFPGRREP